MLQNKFHWDVCAQRLWENSTRIGYERTIGSWRVKSRKIFFGTLPQ